MTPPRCIFSNMNSQTLIVNDRLSAYDIGMTVKVYFSNLSVLWPLARQEQALAPLLPGAMVYRDILSSKDRQARARSSLVDRDSKLLRRLGSKAKGEIIAFASLACVDWTLAGVTSAIAAAHARGATVRVMEPPMEIPVDATSETWEAVGKAFEWARQREKAERAGMVGAKVSGRKRVAAAKAKLELIRDRWIYGDPSEHPANALLAEASVTRNTAIKHLGKRRKR